MTPAADETIETPDVLIVGAGPAGLSAAIALRRAGMGQVVVVERQAEAGGIPRHCGHSPFGLREFHRVLSGRRYADRLTEAALGAGAKLRLCHSVVSLEAGPRAIVAAPEGIIAFAPKRILLTTGIRETSRAGRLVSGDRPSGVMNTGALQDLIGRQRLVPFRRPIIVGSELVSMSAILTCLSAGIRPVAIVEAALHSVVRAPFGWLPHVLRIPTHYGSELTDILGGRGVESVTLRDAHGETQKIACDGVLFTGRFTPESSLARMAGIAIDPATGGPVVDTLGRTSLAGVYAAGNVLRGVETAGWCWAEGKAVAQAIVSDLTRGYPFQGDAIGIEAGEGIKLAMPQNIVRNGPKAAFGAIQVRLDRAVRGELAVEIDTRTVWSRRLMSGPERRVTIPLGALPPLGGAGTLRIRVHAGDQRR